MKVVRSILICSIFILSIFLFSASFTSAQTGNATLELLEQQGRVTSQVVDGDIVTLRLTLPEPVAQVTPLSFRLASTGLEVAGCSIAQGKASCQSEPVDTTGWHWDPNGLAQPARAIQAVMNGQTAADTSVQVGARPVVFVHGFSSDYRAWTNYLGPQGYLASLGIPAFAVGDGQAPGAMNTGNLINPTGRTNTIAQNAQILGDYIAKVKELTGAHRIDLVGHSMGGLISRYYIDQLMPEGEVAQLIMLGSPMLGSECANLPAALGFYLPATLEFHPDYVQYIFNPRITHRRGVAFYALAGDPITDAIQSPCTPVPSDIAVSLQSVSGLPLTVTRMPMLHTDLNSSEQVFREYVSPILQTPPGGFAVQPDPTAEPANLEPMQFTRVFTGHLAQGERRELTIPIEPNVAVASFALFDSSRSLQVEVHGASGKLITLDPVANGLIEIDDPQSMIYLGYGFNNPKPGAWKVTLITGDKTPASGADYSLTAVFQGGAVLEVSTNTLLPKIGEAVDIDSRMSLDGKTLPMEQATVTVRGPDGTEETLQMSLDEAAQVHTVGWQPQKAGLYGLEVRTSATTPDGFPVERSTFLVVEAQPGVGLTTRSALLLVGLCALLAVLMAAGYMGFRRRRTRRREAIAQAAK